MLQYRKGYSSMIKKCLITGITGQVGSILADFLLKILIMKFME